jgi:ATP-dependent helicase HepA
MQKLVVGMKVRYLPQPEWGVGHLEALLDEGVRAQVLFPGREGGAVQVSTRGGALVPVALAVGDTVETARGRPAVISEEVEGGRGLRRYAVRFEDGGDDEYPESELRARRPKPDLLTMLKEGRVGDARAFDLRRAALRLDEERRNDALGALFASRVMVKPHQVGVVQRVLSDRRPRFVLADEVGLGKTIEAGMIFSALRLSGLANRVLVVAPSHLTVQWLGELFHKFNQLFTLMDGERYAQALEERPEESPWRRFDKVVTSLELLSRGGEHRAQAADPEAYWDLVIIDEAHHLKAPKAFAAARALAQNSWGLLLLTATPMQLDPAEYHGLLTLIEPSTAPTLEGFRDQLARQEELSAAVRALLEGEAQGPALQALAARFPDDERLAKPGPQEALLSHLAETYSLSDRLIRNRRAVVGGFSERRLHRHQVTLSEQERAAREQVRQALGTAGGLRGAALSQLLRRLESSPAALEEALEGARALAELRGRLALPRQDAKLEAFWALLERIWKQERGAKVLVFTESRATLEFLRERLQRQGVEALGYHGELALLDRDRQVARFRDPDGPKVLLCTEVGGEGRNFQFAHHLVNYDLPWSPSVMEQRIGRLDRIGQVRPVEIHAFDLEGTLSADVLTLLADAVGVFGETVGGLDAVLEEVEPKLTELALLGPEERRRYAQELSQKVAQARAQIGRSYDPLLDLRSFDGPAVEALVIRGQRRFALEDEVVEGAPEQGLWAIARELDERLEETVTELGRRVGLGVDTDEQVDAFQCAFHFGHALTVEALPGLDITQERTVLGTFWRDTAVEQEEVEYFATGHPIVEALFGFLRDGPYGRTAFRFIERKGPLRARGLELLFLVIPPEPEDTSPGAKVPSRQLSRFLDRMVLHVPVAQDAEGGAAVDASLLTALEAQGRGLKGDEVERAFPGFRRFVDLAVPLATRFAEEELAQLRARAAARVVAEQEAAQERIARALRHQGQAPAQVARVLAAERAHYQRLLEALGKLRLQLDSAAGFLINR